MLSLWLAAWLELIFIFRRVFIIRISFIMLGLDLLVIFILILLSEVRVEFITALSHLCQVFFFSVKQPEFLPFFK